jgi:hypothetical protein
MTRFSIPALASVSVLALGLIAAPATVDLQDEVIGAKSAWAKGGNGGGNGGGHGGGQGGGQGRGHEKAGNSGETEVSATETDELEDGDEEEPTTGKTLPETALEGKRNSAAYHSANYVGGETADISSTGKTVNSNSAVNYSIDPGTATDGDGDEGTEGAEGTEGTEGTEVTEGSAEGGEEEQLEEQAATQ